LKHRELFQVMHKGRIPKMQKKITPYEFEKYLVIALDNKWENLFDEELSFKSFLDKKGRLNIISLQSCQKH
jgi:hypothetical protein